MLKGKTHSVPGKGNAESHCAVDTINESVNLAYLADICKGIYKNK